MRCDEAESLISDHLNGALPEAEAEALEAHLAGCADCQQVQAELRWMAGLLQGVPRVEMPADLGSRIHAALDALDDELPRQQTGTGGLASRIPCDEAEDYFSGHLEGDLDAWEANALTAHLEGCEECRQQLKQLEAVRHLLRAVPRESLPIGLQERIFAAIDEGEDNCGSFEDRLAESIDGTPDAELAAHLAGCADCRQKRTQLEAVRYLLRAVPQEVLPTGFTERVHAAIEREPELVYAAPAGSKPQRRRIPSWMSAMVGAAAAVGLFFVWNAQTGKLPTIETAAVSTNVDVAVNIGFDVAESVDGVTFQIDLPEGLKFVDDKSHPMQAQSVAWRGSLKQGKTVVPVVVRGVRPGRYAIEAYVSKGAMRKKTTIMLPVTGASS